MSDKENSEQEILHVKIVDFDMPFSAMVGLMIKIGIASVPAVIILGVVYFFAAAIFAGLLGT